MPRKPRKRRSTKGAKAAQAAQTCEASCEGDSCEGAITYVPRSVEGGEGLTRELVGAFAAKVRKGLHKTVAAAALGIPVTAYQYWVREGRTQIKLFEAGRRAELGLYGEFVVRVERAEADLHEQLVGVIMSSTDPELILKWMIKRFPKRYLHNGRKVIDDDEGLEEADGKDAETVAQLEARLEAMLKEQGEAKESSE